MPKEIHSFTLENDDLNLLFSCQKVTFFGIDIYFLGVKCFDAYSDFYWKQSGGCNRISECLVCGVKIFETADEIYFRDQCNLGTRSGIEVVY
jgi:hypothetical protein